jgi:hypothetical protein
MRLLRIDAQPLLKALTPAPKLRMSDDRWMKAEPPWSALTPEALIGSYWFPTTLQIP